LALADTVGKSETIAGLNNAELFERLFRQRHPHDEGLLLIAQACSLVYSFQGVALSGQDAELPMLGALIDKSATDIFRGITALKERDLLQERSQWRAILPHAIANRLAEQALRNIPYQVLETVIINGASDRLRRSFSRRLGYLDGSKEARTIVASWLGQNGLLADVANLGELKLAMFNNVAPVLPDAVLAALEAALARADKATLKRCKHFVRLLRSLAYDPAHFGHAVALLAKFAEEEDEKDRDDEAAAVITSLFYIVLSGTHAPVEMRLTAAANLLHSPNATVRIVGVKALAAMMQSDHFSSHYSFEFGARSRDHGYYPPTGKDVGHWFEEVLKLAETFVTSGSPVTPQVQKEIAGNFRGLWKNGGQLDALERISKAIAAKGFWRDGWIAARQSLRYDAKVLPAAALTRLTALEEFLRPKELANKVRALILGAKGGGLDLDDFENDDVNDFAAASARATAAIERLGKDVASDADVLSTLLPELVSGSGKLWEFGRALVLEAENPRAMWDGLVAQFVATPKPNNQVLSGFLNSLQTLDAPELDRILDEVLTNEMMAECFPVLQASVAIDAKGVARLHRALELGKAPITNFFGLAYGRASDPIPAPDFRDLVLAIARKPGGSPVALEIISMRLHSFTAEKSPPSPETIEAGRALLSSYVFAPRTSHADRHDYELGIIVRACLAGSEGAPVAQSLCRNLICAIARRDAHSSDHDDLVEGLSVVQPTVMLDELFAGSDADRKRSVRMIHDMMRSRKHPLNVVSDDIILAWCDADPKARYPFAAALVMRFKRPNHDAPHEWATVTAKLLQKAPKPLLVFNEIVRRLRPGSFSGSFATKLESRLKLLDKLNVGQDPVLLAAFATARVELKAKMDAERRAETEEAKARSGKFE